MAKKQHLVIVESPAKAKTLKKMLGPSYKIEASMGHVRDLPKSDLGIDIEHDFEPKYITIRGKGELLAKLRKEVKNADKVYLATDPDREGESISWHLMFALKLTPDRARRITFNEITKTAVKRSIKEARDLNMQLIDAQQARRVLDRIVGYQLSPLLWDKVKKGLSAGRVQSVALRIICDREDEIQNFVPQEFWTVDVDFELSKRGGKFSAKYYGKAGERAELTTKEETDTLIATLSGHPFAVSDVKKGKRTKKALPPFSTSTLQQEASRAFGYSAAKTMQYAQQLYEGVEIAGHGVVGLVSYIRTDSLRISDEAYEQANAFITKEYGESYLPKQRNEYKSRGRSQDAHEAIRPTDVTLTPEVVKAALTKEQLKVYTLIWERFVASQMTTAEYDTVTIKIAAGENGAHEFRATASIMTFDGYRRVYKKEDEETDAGHLPEMTEGMALPTPKIIPSQHFTQPPPRFSEALLVKTLEENGVGRPSTYAPTISTLTNRNYIVKESKVFYPTELGQIVNDIMTKNFEQIVDIDFTARMEDALDNVEEGETDWKQIIRDFYPSFAEQLKEAETNIAEIEIKDQESDVVCSQCGRKMVYKFGRYGKFLACPGFPDCRNTQPIHEEAGVDCPLCGKKVLVKKSKKGRTYYGCEGNPECTFVTWDKPTGTLCPDCGSPLVERGTKTKRICCSKCQYKETPAEK